MKRDPRFNASGCLDITAFEAIGKVSRAERKASGVNPKPQKVYICSPFAGDIETNVSNALRYCRFAVEQGKITIAPHCYFPRFMDDGNPSERELAISFAVQLLYECKALWIFGAKITEGMKREILAAKLSGVRIKQFNERMEEM